MYHLSDKPYIVEKIRKEANEILTKDTEITYDLISKLKYTDAVVKETLRLSSPVSMLATVVGKETNLLGHKLNKDVKIKVKYFY